MLLRHILSALLLAAAAAALEVGDKAPGLNGVSWVKGAAPASAGAITVVEFWATWCAPCLDSIPHLSKLQRRHGDKIGVVGLSSEERTAVEPFVAKMGDRMAYRVGLASEQIHDAWMAGRNSIPVAFLVDAGGSVLWIGHPMEIDRPLQQAVAGTFNPNIARRVAPLHQELQTLLQGEQQDPQAVLAVVDRLLAIDPLDAKAVELRIAVARFTKDDTLLRSTLTALPIKDLPAGMASSLAWDLAADARLTRRNLDLALAFARQAVAQDGRDGDSLQALARVLYALGRIEDAIAWQQKAVAAAPEDKELAANLAYYQGVLRLREGAAATP